MACSQRSIQTRDCTTLDPHFTHLLFGAVEDIILLSLMYSILYFLMLESFIFLVIFARVCLVFFYCLGADTMSVRLLMWERSCREVSGPNEVMFSGVHSLVSINESCSIQSFSLITHML